MPDYSFIAQPQGASMNALGSIMTNLGALQQYRINQLNLQQKQETLPADIARAKALSEQAGAEANVATQTQAPRIAGAQSQAQSLAFKLQGDQAATARQIAGGLLSDQEIQRGNSEGSIFALMRAEDQMKNAGIPEHIIKAQMAPFYTMATHAPEKLLPMLKQVAGANVASGQQLQNAFPAPQQVNTGQVQIPVATGNPALTGVQPGTIQGLGVQNQLPPTTPVFNPATNAPGYVGATGGGAPGGPVQSAPALGVSQAVEGAAVTAAADWKQTFEASQKAAQNVGVLQEIKKYAPGAVAGVVQDRRAFITGLAGLIGMDAGQMEKTDTDLLAKNSNMLALAGGNTNLAKELAEVANPNVHMTKEAITKAADQVIAQQQLQLLRAKYLEPFKGNPTEYSRNATEFNQYADPRVLQYPVLSVKDRVEMKKAMNPREQAEFANKLRFFQSRGMLQ